MTIKSATARAEFLSDYGTDVDAMASQVEGISRAHLYERLRQKARAVRLLWTPITRLRRDLPEETVEELAA